MEWKCASCLAVNPESAHFCGSCGAPNPGASEVAEAAVTEAAGASTIPVGAVPQAAEKKKNKTALIVLIVLAVLLIPCLVIGGIIAAIAVPNLLEAMQKGKQKRAVEDVKKIATAVLEYRVENGAFPDTGHAGGLYYSTVDAADLKSFLCPKYTQDIPVKDGWGHPYQYGVSQDNSEFIVICSGSDGATEITEMPTEVVTTGCYEDDVIWENEGFVQMPDGKQRKCK